MFHYHETCIFPTPINYAAYWALSYSNILQTFSEEVTIVLRQLFGG